MTCPGLASFCVGRDLPFGDQPFAAECQRHQPGHARQPALLAFGTVHAVAQSSDASFPAPPEGFDGRRDSIDHGKLELVEYDSTTVGIKRKARVYTLPGYSADHKYPVPYILDGIGGDEMSGHGAVHLESVRVHS